MKQINKIYLIVKNILLYLKLKFFYRINISSLCWARGRFELLKDKTSSCDIGNQITTLGPMYIKCLNNSKLKIGNNCFFNHNCSITCAGEITIGDGCDFANNIVIVDHDHRVGKTGVQDELLIRPIKIGNGVWIGANVTVLKGVTIGDGAVIAANSVVNTNVEANTLVAGVPVRYIKNID